MQRDETAHHTVTRSGCNSVSWSICGLEATIWSIFWQNSKRIGKSAAFSLLAIWILYILLTVMTVCLHPFEQISFLSKHVDCFVWQQLQQRLFPPFELKGFDGKVFCWLSHARPNCLQVSLWSICSEDCRQTCGYTLFEPKLRTPVRDSGFSSGFHQLPCKCANIDNNPQKESKLKSKSVIKR